MPTAALNQKRLIDGRRPKCLRAASMISPTGVSASPSSGAVKRGPAPELDEGFILEVEPGELTGHEADLLARPGVEEEGELLAQLAPALVGLAVRYGAATAARRGGRTPERG